MKRIIRGISALIVIAAITIGAPVLLLIVGRLDALSLPLVYSPSTILGFLTLVSWLAWSLATLSVVAELISALTNLKFRLPGLGGFSSASAVLVTALLGLAAASAAGGSSADQTTSSNAEFISTLTISDSATNGVIDSADSQAAQSDSASSSKIHYHTVLPGEDLWTLAETFLGDGTAWRQIAKLNETILVSPTSPLTPGMQLAIPGQPASTNSSVVAVNAVEENPHSDSSPSDKVLVRPGDSLWKIADEKLGDGQLWPQLVDANPSLSADPNNIQPGWQLNLPPATIASDTDSLSVSAPANPQALNETVIPESESFTPQSLDISQDVLDENEKIHADAVGQLAENNDSGLSLAGLIGQYVPASAGISAGLAAGLFGALRFRRRRQALQRPLGKALPAMPPRAAELSSALSALGARSLGDSADKASELFNLRLGESGSKEILIPIFTQPLITVHPQSDEAIGLLTAVALTCVNNSNIEVVAAGDEFSWLTSLDEPRLDIQSRHQALQLLQRTIEARSAEEITFSQAQLDPDLSEAWRPIVFIFNQPLAAQDLPAAKELGDLGISLLCCAERPGEGINIHLVDDSARLGDQLFSPDFVSPPARRALEEAFDAAASSDYPAASWWFGDESLQDATGLVNEQSNIIPLPLPLKEPVVQSSHSVSSDPFLLLLGSVELAGARGDKPSRAVKQCIEYCAWLLENPGANAPMMAKSLLVAETTRRSNMSRLRSWLGSDDNGQQYLPDAYSGSIRLHPSVSSDWEQFRLLLAAGINRASDDALCRALELVRGAPLADAAPGQWHWAEELRFEISTMIRDAGLVLGERALEAGNLDLARWAASRALTAAPEDELLMCLKIKTEYRAGNRSEVERLVLHVTRQARMLGVDLLDETVVVLQQAIEGQARLRHA